MVGETLGEKSRDSLNREESLDWQHSLTGNVPEFEIILPLKTIDDVNFRFDKLIWNQGSTFIIGNNFMGEVGDDRLGSFVDAGSEIRIFETRMYQDHLESYDSTDFRDPDQTSAFWTTSGSILFGGGSVIYTSESEFSTGDSTTGIGSEGGSLALL